MATDLCIRLMFRVEVPDAHHPRDSVDLAVPAHSSLSDVLGEVLELTEAPHISSPWQALTAAGLPIDPAAPLGLAGIRRGCHCALA